MKNIQYYIVFIAVFFVSSIWSQSTQRANHLVVSDNFRFYYFDTPSTSTPYLISNSDVRNGSESGAFWSNTSMAKFHEFLRALLKDPNNGGDAQLQYLAAKLVQINSRRIMVRLWNDVSPLSSSDVSVSNKPCISDSHVWPCASHWTTADNSYWGGYMHLGIHYSNQNGLTWLKETFLHELMHTQDATNQLGNSYVVFGKSYRYGADGSHFFTEAIPNKRLAYMEAIANVAPFYYNFSDFNRRFSWFTSNGDLLVERNAPSNWIRTLGRFFGSGYSDNVWLYDEIRNHPSGSAGRNDPNNAGYSRFSIQSLPGKFIVHNELIMAMMMTMTSMHVADIDPFIWATKTFNTRISSNQNQDPLALFVKIFAEGMLQHGETFAAIKQELDSRNYSSADVDTPYTFILPLAYSDYFTGYASTSKSQFQELFNNEMDSNLVDIYWDHFKDRVRTGVPIRSGRSWTDMTTIATQCGVNQSYLPGTSGRRYEGN